MHHRFKTVRQAVATLLFSVIAHAGHAGDAITPAVPPKEPADAKPTGGVWTFINENDLYSIKNRDRHYSNGVRLAWISDDNDVPEWSRGLPSFLPLLDPAVRQRIGWAVGHNLYTPQDKESRDYIPDDRPYAAWLYGGMALQSESDTRLDTIELDIGVIGPAALGKPIQNNYHPLVGAKKAYGWNNQLKNEPGIVLSGERKWRVMKELPVYDLGIDMIPHVSGSVGNIFTYAGAGATFRFGDDLKSDFGPPRIRPALPGSDAFKSRDTFGWYLFAGGEGRLVVRDIFLDGNTFTDSHNISKKPIVGDFQAGFALLFERFRVTFTQVMRTKEFDAQDRPDFFGSISLSARF